MQCATERRLDSACHVPHFVGMVSFVADTVFYAIGDVHGVADRLQILHDRIFAHHRSAFSDRHMTLIHLGDYVDRGEASAQVIDMIMEMENRASDNPLLDVFSLRGNHEQMMLEAIDGNSSSLDVWLQNGGRATLRSYAKPDQDPDEVLYKFPLKHKRWLNQLPNVLHDAEKKLVFVHAGVNPLSFPDCDPQHYIWTRSQRFFDPSRWRESLDGYVVVHGHTPTRDKLPQVAGNGRRINVDSGAVYGGPLSCVILAKGAEPEFLTIPLHEA